MIGSRETWIERVEVFLEDMVELEVDLAHSGLRERARDLLAWHGEIRSQPKQRMSRTLVRVVERDEELGTCTLVVPGWGRSRQFLQLRAELPQEVWEAAEPGKRFHAKVNLGATMAADLRFEGWELS